MRTQDEIREEYRAVLSEISEIWRETDIGPVNVFTFTAWHRIDKEMEWFESLFVHIGWAKSLAYVLGERLPRNLGGRKDWRPEP